MHAQHKEYALMPHANSEGPDQPAHPPSQIRAVCARWHIQQYPWIMWADNESPDQPAQMRRLILAFVARTSHKGVFAGLALYIDNTGFIYLQFEPESNLSSLKWWWVIQTKINTFIQRNNVGPYWHAHSQRLRHFFFFFFSYISLRICALTMTFLSFGLYSIKRTATPWSDYTHAQTGLDRVRYFVRQRGSY